MPPLGRNAHREPLADPRRRRRRAYLYRLGLRLEHVQPSLPGLAAERPGVVQPALHHLFDRAGSAGTERRVRRPLGGAPRTARGRDRSRIAVRLRTHHWRDRSGAAPVDPGVPGHGRHRRDGLRARLHRAREHADQMVPRPARHGHRHGHHGIRRRSGAGQSAERPFHEFARRPGRRDDAGRHLLRADDDRRPHPAAAARGLETRRLESP